MKSVVFNYLRTLLNDILTSCFTIVLIKLIVDKTYFITKKISPCLKCKTTKVLQNKIHGLNKLKNNELNSNQKKVTISQKVNIVRIKGIATESKARQTRKDLINLGFKNSFIQFPLNQPS